MEAGARSVGDEQTGGVSLRTRSRGSCTAESTRRSAIRWTGGDTSAGAHCSSSTSLADWDIRD